MMKARKLSFNEIWKSSTFFYINEELEAEIESKVNNLIEAASHPSISETSEVDVINIRNFLLENDLSLDVILKDITLSEEKFKRIISLLRFYNKIPGGFDTEWSINRIKSKIISDHWFASFISILLVDGCRNKFLNLYVPRYYFEKLNYREFRGSSITARKIRYKGSHSISGSYGGKKRV